MIDLKQKKLAKWQRENFPDTKLQAMSKEELILLIRILQVTLGMAEEVGEICHHVLKGSQGIRGGVNGMNKREIADGLGDTTIYGTQLMSALGIDAEVGIAETISQVLTRDWNKDPSGSNTGCPVQDDIGIHGLNDNHYEGGE